MSAIQGHDTISERQLCALCFAALFSPLIRLLPRLPAAFAGRAAWLSPLAAAAAGALWLAFLRAFLRRRAEGEGLFELAERCLGPAAGRVLAALCALWLVFYGGVMLRVSAERFLSTIYANGRPTVFIAVMGAAAGWAAAGGLRQLARTAEVLLALILLAMGAVFLFSLTEVEPARLLPVKPGDAGGILLGALPMLDMMSVYAYGVFLLRYVKKTPEEGRRPVRWMLLLTAAATAVLVMTVGAASAELVKDMQSPFFLVIRSIAVLGFIERIEAVVVGLWVAADFLLLAFVWLIAGDILKLLAGGRSRRPFAAGAAAVSIAAAFAVADNAFFLRKAAEYGIPAVNLAAAFVLLPALFLVGRARGKL